MEDEDKETGDQEAEMMINAWPDDSPISTDDSIEIGSDHEEPEEPPEDLPPDIDKENNQGKDKTNPIMNQDEEKNADDAKNADKEQISHEKPAKENMKRTPLSLIHI